MLTYMYVMVSSYFATLKNEEGQGMAEYGLILALVALAVIGGFTFLGTQIDTFINGVGAEMVLPD